jgi:ribonuclease HI
MNRVEIWVDGSCKGNPGPMGIGVVICKEGHKEESSRYVGRGTNNRAELLALIAGLETLQDRALHDVIVYTDSTWVWGIFNGWKIKENLDLVWQARKLVSECKTFEIRKVNGHAGITLNERCNKLAMAAAKGQIAS